MADCLFCSIVAEDIPADIVLSNDDIVAFRDIAPQAPVHVLVVPREPPRQRWRTRICCSGHDRNVAAGGAGGGRERRRGRCLPRRVQHRRRRRTNGVPRPRPRDRRPKPRMASRMSNAASDSDARMTIEIPNSQPMVALLGSNDEYLRLIENAFPSVSVLVRGNEIRLDGPAEDSAVIDSLIAEMLAMLRTGQALSTESVERSISMLRSGTRPSDVLTANILSNRGRTIRPKTLNQKRYVDAIDKNTVVFESARPAPARPTWRCQGGAGAAGQAGEPHRVDPPRRRSGGALGLPSRNSERKDRSLPAPPCMTRCTT